MKLSTKITCTLGALFVCVTLLCTFSLHRLYAINQLYGETARVGFPLTVTAQRLVILLSEYRRNEVNHVHSADMDGKRRSTNRLSDLQQSIEESLVTYTNTAQAPSQAAQAREMERLWNEYSQTSSSVRHLSLSRMQNEAVILLNTRSSDLYDTLSSLLDRVASANAQFSEKTLESGNDLYAQSRTLLGTMMLGMLCFMACLGFYLVRSIVVTLGADPTVLGELTRRVASGGVVEDPPPNASGVYADILSMMQDIQHNDNNLQTLTANIPGAVLRTKHDDLLTITYCSEGFFGMTGYTRDELTFIFDNQFLAMITPEDRSQSMQSMREQLIHSSTYEVEYRIMHKAGHDVWVLDRGRIADGTDGEPLMYCVLIDISELKLVQLRLRVQEERLRTVLSVSNDMVWECDGDRLFRFIKGADVWLQVYGAYPKNYNEAVEMAHTNCHPDDKGIFAEAFTIEHLANYLKQGVTSIRLEHRIATVRTGIYTWFQSIVVPFTGLDGEIERVVACVTNIDDRKTRETKILKSAQRDPLTNLLNKGYTEDAITCFLEGVDKDSCHALFIIDVDNFKAVNDNLGHLFGDAVLTDIATTLSHLFRAQDVVGRIGGDEFMVLMCNITDPEIIHTKGKELVSSLRRSFGRGTQTYSISGSIGIAVYPEDGTTYRALYNNADQALYMAKDLGKSRYCFFTQTLSHPKPSSPRPGRTDIATRKETASFKDNVMLYIFELLYEARDMNAIISIALGMIGEHYNVSRAYVLLASEEHQTLTNTYEWCNNGIASEKERLQNVPYKDCGNYINAFTDGMFNCSNVSTLDQTLRDILEPQGIKSMLHINVYDNGQFRGSVGFDDCVENRVWTADEVSSLSSLAKVLSLFMFKSLLGRTVEEARTTTTTILDCMDIYSYVCDTETYELLHMNAKTRSVAPDAELGIPCYQAFFGGRNTPCEHCPRAGLHQGAFPDSSPPMLIFNETLKLWTQSTASAIPWADGQHAVLVSCIDVTQYVTAGGSGGTIELPARDKKTLQ